MNGQSSPAFGYSSTVSAIYNYCQAPERNNSALLYQTHIINKKGCTFAYRGGTKQCFMSRNVHYLDKKLPFPDLHHYINSSTAWTELWVYFADSASSSSYQSVTNRHWICQKRWLTVCLRNILSIRAHLLYPSDPVIICGN